MRKEYLSDEEVSKLILKAKDGDNDAWTIICDNYKDYIVSMVRKITSKVNISEEQKVRIEEDLISEGWLAFVQSIKTFDPSKGTLTTYLYKPISGAISKGLEMFLNPLGLTERPDKLYVQSIENADSSGDLELLFARKRTLSSGRIIDPELSNEKFNKESTTLQMLELLKYLTDENNTLTQEELFENLWKYRILKHNKDVKLEDDRTLRATIKNILNELNPSEYSEANESNYKIRYEGYKENRLKNNEKGVTNFSYVHPFSNDELDVLIEQVCFSNLIPAEMKTRLVEKIISTASVYYRSPFWDGEVIRFNPKSVHSRLDSRNVSEKKAFAYNIRVLQEALNNMGQVRFKFCRYNDKGLLEPTSEHEHILSPYHIVVYHDNFYCIGLKKNDKRVWHYRIDLMSDIEIIRDEEGKVVPIEISKFAGTPISNLSWNPEKYMAEHLNMSYDEPRDILVKIKNTDYTILHDWFGNHYVKTRNLAEEGYDIVSVTSSPSMMVHWAMQYGAAVEIMDEDIRAKIREEIERIGKKYL